MIPKHGRKRATPEVWAQIKRDLGTDQFRLLWIKPEENVLLGWWKICDYLGIRDRKTLKIWAEHWALPAIKRPDGMWMSTVTAIDQWIMLAAQATAENAAISLAERLARDPELAERMAKYAPSKAQVDRGTADEDADSVRSQTVSGPVG
jgi:hypothetical protein